MVWKIIPDFSVAPSAAFQFDFSLFLSEVWIKTKRLISIEHAFHTGELWKFLSYF